MANSSRSTHILAGDAEVSPQLIVIGLLAETRPCDFVGLPVVTYSHSPLRPEKFKRASTVSLAASWHWPAPTPAPLQGQQHIPSWHSTIDDRPCWQAARIAPSSAFWKENDDEHAFP
jgi:hypothetical protein